MGAWEGGSTDEKLGKILAKRWSVGRSGTCEQTDDTIKMSSQSWAREKVQCSGYLPDTWPNQCLTSGTTYSHLRPLRSNFWAGAHRNCWELSVWSQNQNKELNRLSNWVQWPAPHGWFSAPHGWFSDDRAKIALTTVRHGERDWFFKCLKSAVVMIA